ncbi:MAG: metallo-beta-lactamase family protein [Gammaproteobacteria bacterium]|nr:metallo-beta-lactamase family protein [Gammaproteobacteria bacterium]
MPISGSVAVQLRPALPGIPSMQLLREWRKAAFEPRACRHALEAWMKRFSIPEDWFDTARIESGGTPATDRFLFEAFTADADWRWKLHAPAQGGRFCAEVPLEDVPEVAQVVKEFSRADTYAEFRGRYRDSLDEEILLVMSKAFSPEHPFGVWPEHTAPGIYRREHASILISSGTTTVIFDPQTLSGEWTTAHGRSPHDRSPCTDAVIITHSHGDHWHLPSVLKHCHAGTRVIVPQVPRRNLLTQEDLAQSLTLAGQKHDVLGWGSRITIGDLEIEALPFFGEQPTRTRAPPPEGVRNWGNCYRVNGPHFSALVLADSGGDPMGEMRDVIAASVASDGGVDVLLSCCESFPEGINEGLPDYVLTLPFETLRVMFTERQEGRWHSMTAGVGGVADLCAVARARFYLPYAHGFAGLGVDPGATGAPGYGEGLILHALRGALVRAGAPTEVVSWSPGDHFAPRYA